MEVVIGAVKLGLIYSLVSLGIFLTLRVIDFPDMSVNSSFTLGAALSGVALVNGVNPIVATIVACIGGSLVGGMTAWLHVARGIQNLLSGIIVMIGLYSINLRVLDKPNLPLLHISTILSGQYSMWILAFIIIAVCCAITYFLLSDIGLAIRASGQNSRFGEAYGVGRNFTIYSMLALSNGLVALAGSLFSQLEGFVDIGMGNGILIIGLASVIIGERLFISGGVVTAVIGAVVGSVIYRLIIALSLMSSDLGMRTSDIYLATSLISVVMMIGKRKERQ